MKNKLLVSIFLVVFIDLLGFSLILPLLPYYAKTFNASDTTVGLLVAIYAAAQMIGAPLIGRLSDRYGRRPLLLLSIAGTFAGFLMLAFAHSLAMLFLARIVDGLTAGNLSIAQAYISDVTDAKNRSRSFGMIGAAFGLGFIIGPAVGGALSQFGYMVPALAAAALSFINLVLVGAWLPESLTAEKRAEMTLHQRAPLTIKDLIAALQRPRVGPLLHTRFFFGLAFSLFQTIFTLYALERFNIDAQRTGYILAYVGILSVITQGFLIGKLTARFAETRLIFVTAMILTLSLVGWALAPDIITLLVIMAPTSFAAGVLNTIINSVISKSVPTYEVGGMLGISSSIEAATRVLAPVIGGFLLDQVGRSYGAFAGTAAPAIFAALVMAWLVSYIYRNVLNLPLGPGEARGGAAAQVNAGE